MDRKQRLLGSATRTTRIMEIGAGYAPLAPKSDGWLTHVVDHASQEALRAKYATAGVDTSVIEEVDTIWHGGPLEASLPPGLVGRVDMIIVSHVLEHLPDLIGFLRSASTLVAPDGCISVAQPDRRYCFDCFKPWTTTGDLLDAYHHRLSRHSLRTVFNQMAYSATINGQLGWGPWPIELPTLLDPFQAAADSATSFKNTEDRPYEDCHAWQFSPASFRLVLLELCALGLTDWTVENLEGPENFEFFATLRRGVQRQLSPEALQEQRRSLLVEHLREVQEQATFMLHAAEKPKAAAETANLYYEDLARLVVAQDMRLAEMAETLAWVRAGLTPVRRIWRAVRRKPR
jgi:SAM-dependent methyltransferase